jgi:hypothetical protein
MPETINPYAPPKAEVADVVPTLAGEAGIRQEHIKTEAAIRSIGVLYYLFGGLMLLGSVVLLARVGSPAFADGFPIAGFVLLFLVLGLAAIFVGRGIRNLRPWARIAVIMLASLGCIVGVAKLSLGILVQVYILYLLFSKKGRRIFASDYPDIVAATPEIKYRTSIVIWILLGLVVLLILAALTPMALQK